MKKYVALLMALSMMISMTACGENKKTEEAKASAFTSGEEILNKVFESYKDDEKFPVSGGDADNYVEDKAASFDLSKTEELDFLLGISGEQAGKMDAAATLTHMMNSNTFTAAVYHIKSDTDMDALAQSIVDGLANKQWVCGQPQTLVAIAMDKEYLAVCFGQDDLVQNFKTRTAEVIKDSKVIAEKGI